MPTLQLGALAAGQSRTYRFAVAMLDGGAPSSPYVDDNVYQRATASLGYEWTLTEIEAGAPESGEPPGSHEPWIPQLAPGPVAPNPSPGGDGKSRSGTPHADSLFGTAKADVIHGLAGPDSIFGKRGPDYLLGDSGGDRVHGGAGADRLRGGIGSDRIYGEAGSDVIYARDGEADVVDCGDGQDLAYVDEHDLARGCEIVKREYGRLFPNR
jgi:Ca2+-binding RTX toxin-like protein